MNPQRATGEGARSSWQSRADESRDRPCSMQVTSRTSPVRPAESRLATWTPGSVVTAEGLTSYRPAYEPRRRVSGQDARSPCGNRCTNRPECRLLRVDPQRGCFGPSAEIAQALAHHAAYAAANHTVKRRHESRGKIVPACSTEHCRPAYSHVPPLVVVQLQGDALAPPTQRTSETHAAIAASRDSRGRQRRSGIRP